MELNDYQTRALRTAQYPADVALSYLTLGLVGEAGEVANKIKKVLRGDYDDDPKKAEHALEEAGFELADCLWYIAVLADELGVRLDDLAEANLSKLLKRQEDGTIKGTGDHR